MSGFGKATKAVGGLIAAAFAGGAAISGIKTMVNSASDLNETISKTQTIFGKSSPAIMKWADGAATSLGLSKQAALDGVSTFGNFFNQIGIGAKETERMSKGFVQASVDLGSFHNAAPVEVMDALSAATRGEYDSLQKFIPTINAARVEMEAMRQTGKASAKELTDQDKARAVSSLVMKGQGKAAGDFARTQDSLANRTKIAKAQFDNMVATLGGKLLPVATAAMGFISSTALPALQRFGSFAQDNVVPALKQMATFFKQNQTVLVALAGGLVAAGAAWGIYTGIMKVSQAVTTAVTVAQRILNGTMRANPIGLVITAIGLLVAGFILAYKKSETFRNIVNGAFNGIKKVTQKVFPVIKTVIVTVFKAVFTAIKTYVNIYKAIITTAWNIIKAATKAAWNIFKSAVLNPVKAVVGFVRSAMGNVRGFVSNAWNAAKSLTASVWNGIKNSVTTAISNLMDKVRGIKSAVMGAFSGAASWLLNAGRDIIGGLLNGIQSMIGKVEDKLRELTNKIPDLKGPANVDKVLLRKNGQLIIQGLIDGFDDKDSAVRDSLGRLTNNIGQNYGRDFKTPQFTSSTSSTGSSSAAPVINVYAHPTNNPAELGRTVANALDSYYKQGGRRAAV
ncbi:hypothetical protein [Nocardioides sp. Leaf307]|uniref:phage tail protein n=1 Tax=Nocardioides sp. Leaf307 TaxID=1736331 RepID=UPI0012EAEAA5|nr:hypothetical protein [Nocardioides sp. Leaf307]